MQISKISTVSFMPKTNSKEGYKNQSFTSQLNVGQTGISSNTMTAISFTSKLPKLEVPHSATELPKNLSSTIENVRKSADEARALFHAKKSTMTTSPIVNGTCYKLTEPSLPLFPKREWNFFTVDTPNGNKLVRVDVNNGVGRTFNSFRFDHETDKLMGYNYGVNFMDPFYDETSMIFSQDNKLLLAGFNDLIKRFKSNHQGMMIKIDLSNQKIEDSRRIGFMGERSDIVRHFYEQGRQPEDFPTRMFHPETW